MRNWIIGCYLLLTPMVLEAAQVVDLTVHDLRTTDIEGMFYLDQDSVPEVDEAILDCLSFINGIKLTRSDQSVFFMLSEAECVEVYQNVVKGREKGLKTCVHLDFDNGIYHSAHCEE